MRQSIKSLLVIVAYSMSMVYVFAQDIIVKRDGTELRAIVVEVGTQVIKYEKYENPGGPTYSINKATVFMIRYENGTKDVFNDAPPSNNQKQVNSQPAEFAKGSFNVNPLGFLQFGPIFMLETRISQRSYFTPYFRYAFAGVATHSVWTGFEEDSELSPGSAAIGLGLRSFNSAENSWYYGALLDYAWTTARYDVSEVDATEEKATNLGLASNFGYRWRSGRGTYINLGLLAGASFTLKDEERYINTGELYDTYSEVTFFGMLELAFGWDFK